MDGATRPFKPSKFSAFRFLCVAADALSRAQGHRAFRGVTGRPSGARGWRRADGRRRPVGRHRTGDTSHLVELGDDRSPGARTAHTGGSHGDFPRDDLRARVGGTDEQQGRSRIPAAVGVRTRVLRHESHRAAAARRAANRPRDGRAVRSAHGLPGRLPISVRGQLDRRAFAQDAIRFNRNDGISGSTRSVGIRGFRVPLKDLAEQSLFLRVELAAQLGSPPLSEAGREVPAARSRRRCSRVRCATTHWSACFAMARA